MLTLGVQSQLSGPRVQGLTGQEVAPVRVSARDLARAALEIAAEDDALVSHSPVALPVPAYLARLDSMASELALHHLPVRREDRTPEAVLAAIDRYLYHYKVCHVSAVSHISVGLQASARNECNGPLSRGGPLTGGASAVRLLCNIWQGFKRASAAGVADARDLYLNGVLTRARGTSVMLALVYSELATRMRHLGAIDFRVEMELPLDPISLPHPRVVLAPSSAATGGSTGTGSGAVLGGGTPVSPQEERSSRRPAPGGVASVADPDLTTVTGEDVRAMPPPTEEEEEERRGGTGGDYGEPETAPRVILTAQLLLYEVLRALKELYWPWRWHGRTGGSSGFVEAAEAATSGGSGVGSMGSSASSFEGGQSAAEQAASRAARYRLQRGIWTTTGFGDLRRALAACERLVMLGVDAQEGRDYGVLLFHSGLYPQAYAYLSAYAASRAEEKRQVAASGCAVPNALGAREDAALAALLERLQLLMVEQAWLLPSSADAPPPEPLPEPW
eukprot:jgi/Mesen1/8899/ME000535S08207